MRTKQQKREAGSLPYALIHAQVWERHLTITSTCKTITGLVVFPSRLTSRYLVSEADHKNRMN